MYFGIFGNEGVFQLNTIPFSGCFQEIVVIQLMTVVKVISNAPFYVNLVTATAVRSPS